MRQVESEWDDTNRALVEGLALHDRQVHSDGCGFHPAILAEPDIYRYLLVSFDLSAQECLFIDDSPANVAAAQALGLQGMVFTDAAACRRQLVEQGWLPA